MNVYAIEHHDIYDRPEQLCVVVGTRVEARNKAREMRKSRGVVRERYIRPAREKDVAKD